MSDFISALKHFANVEYEAQTPQIWEMWRQPLNVRVAASEAIANVEIVRVDGNRTILRHRDNLSKFRTGEVMILHRGDPPIR